jgi:hypothetical protein
MRRRKHLRAQPHKKQVQAMQRLKHLRAQLPKKRLCKECGASGKSLTGLFVPEQISADHDLLETISCFPEHNRQRSKCKPCGGASICEHNRRL